MLKRLYEVLQDVLLVQFLSCYLAKRHGIGCGREEDGLIHIKSYACYRAAHLVGLPDVLYQDTCQFFILEIEVVGPFDSEQGLLVFFQYGANRMIERKTHYLVDKELAADGY